jgi:hypothetical protein
VATFLNDTFTGASGTTLTAHPGETGATWTKHGSSGAGTMALSDANRLRVGTTGGVIIYYSSGTPAGPDYEVFGPVVAVTAGTTRVIGVTGRMDTVANTYYAAFYDGANNRWELRAVVAGVVTTLGTFAQAMVNGTSYEVRLRMAGSRISLLVDGVERVIVTDTSITAAGRAGVFGATASTNTTAVHLDSITALDVNDVYLAAAVSATATLAAAGNASGQGGALAAAVSSLSPTPAVDAPVGAALAGAGSLSGAAFSGAGAGAGLSAVAALSPSAQVVVLGSSSLAGVGRLAGSLDVFRPDSVIALPRLAFVIGDSLHGFTLLYDPSR